MRPETLSVYDLLRSLLQSENALAGVYIADVRETIDGPVVKRSPVCTVLDQEGNILLVRQDDYEVVDREESGLGIDDEDEEDEE